MTTNTLAKLFQHGDRKNQFDSLILHPMRIFRLYPLFLILLLPLACKKQDSCSPDPRITSREISLELIRLDAAFQDAEDARSIQRILEEHPEFTTLFFGLDALNQTQELAESLFDLHQDAIFKPLDEALAAEFGDITALEKELTEAFQHFTHYFPQEKLPRLYFINSGFAADFILDEDIIIIGLEYFLPEESGFAPPELPYYIRKRYAPAYLVPNLMTALSTRFNATQPEDRTLLAEMIYYGKAYHFTKTLLPCTPDSLIIGYTADEVAASYANERYIWSFFVEQDLFFETNPFIIRKYTGEAPNTDEISPDAPGRLGRWLGWNIVDDFQIKEGLDLETLMAEPRADHVFRASGYRPRE
ncbi:gliding motility lipoprotein GldB [Nitritalea halalkaliphila]|nr:gliding motility lipoprotein GldB [Nitritalea halalkaliphila]